MAKKPKTPSNQITNNRKARHLYQIESTFEAGLVLEGWEVKSLRDHRVQINDSHIIIRKGEAWLLNAHITPLKTACTHTAVNPTRTRKLLLHKRELSQLIGKIEQQGYTLIPLSLFWKRNKIKMDIALAKGKKLHDKRASDRDRDWERQKARMFKTNSL